MGPSEWVGIDVWGDQHPYVGFEAIAEVKTPGEFAIVQPTLSVYVEPIADTLLFEVACQAYRQDGTQPSIKVWTSGGEETHAVTNGKPSSFVFVSSPGSSQSASAVLQMVNPQVTPLPKNGGNWAVFEITVTPLAKG